MFVYRHLFTRSSACVAHTKTITYLVCYCFCLGHAGNTHGKQKMLNKHGSSSLVFTHPGDKKCNYYYYYSQNRQFLPIWGVKSATTSSTATVDSFYHPGGKKCNNNYYRYYREFLPGRGGKMCNYYYYYHYNRVFTIAGIKGATTTTTSTIGTFYHHWGKT